MRSNDGMSIATWREGRVRLEYRACPAWAVVPSLMPGRLIECAEPLQVTKHTTSKYKKHDSSPQ